VPMTQIENWPYKTTFRFIGFVKRDLPARYFFWGGQARFIPAAEFFRIISM
jgi:hypothetical protein